MSTHLNKRSMLTAGFLALMLLFGVFYYSSTFQKVPSSSPVTLAEARGLSNALPFIPNGGQLPDSVQFLLEISNGMTYVTDSDIRYVFRGDNGGYALFEWFVDLDGNQLDITVSGEVEAPTVYSLFRGEKSEWLSGLNTFSTISLGQVYPGVEVELIDRVGTMEKIFRVAPEAQVKDIRIQVDGMDYPFIDEDGNLVMVTAQEKVLFTKPVAYQDIDGERIDVDAEYVLDGTTYGFSVGEYNESYELVIDPLLASTYLGVAGNEFPEDLFVHSDGSVYVLGRVDSGNAFPVTAGAYDETGNNNVDFFVSKFDADLTTLQASTFIGSTGSQENPRDIIVDSSGNVYILGISTGGYPTTSGAYLEAQVGSDDGVISKLSSDLTTLNASTYFGSSAADDLFTLALDSNEKPHVVGMLRGGVTFPGTPYADHWANGDGVIARFSQDLSTVEAGTYIGGFNTDRLYGIDFDSSGNIFVAGYTEASNYPTTSGAYAESRVASNEIVVSKLDVDMENLLASTYLGGSDIETAYRLEIASDDTVVIAGFTESGNFPTTAGAYEETHSGNGNKDGFISILSNDLTTLNASTVVAASDAEEFIDMELGSGDVVYVYTAAGSDYPVTTGAYDETYGGNDSLGLSLFSSDLSELTASTYVSSDTDRILVDSNEYQGGLALGSSDRVYFIFQTEASDFPTTGTSYDQTKTGGGTAIDLYIGSFDSTLTLLGLDEGVIEETSASLSSTAFGATGVTYTLAGTVNSNMDADDTLVFTFPDEPNGGFDLSAVDDADVGITASDVTKGTVIVSTTLNTVTVPFASGTLSGGESFSVSIADIGNPSNANGGGGEVYGISFSSYDEGTTLLEQGIAYAELNNDVSVTAIVAEALIMTLSGDSISLTVDPAVNDGQDLTESSTFTVSSNSPSGYVLKARLDDGSGSAQLVDGNGNVISSDQASGENYFSYTARNDGTGSATVAEQDFSETNTTVLDDADGSIGLGTVTDNQQHTVNYDLNVNFLTPAGVYTGTIYYTVVASF